MAHHLFLTSKLDIPRRQRFPDRFVDDIAALVCAISADIASRYHKVHSPQSYTFDITKVLNNEPVVVLVSFCQIEICLSGIKFLLIICIIDLIIQCTVTKESHNIYFFF